MHEIHVRTGVDSCEQCGSRGNIREGVPAHVGHLQACPRHKPGDPAGQQAQARAAESLVAVLEEELMPEADAEHGPAGRRHVSHRLAQTPVGERPRRDRECAHTRKHDTGAGGDDVGLVTDHRLSTGSPERALDAAQISDSVIADADLQAHSVPFVEGTPPPITRNASRVASPSALNAASAM